MESGHLEDTSHELANFRPSLATLYQRPVYQGPEETRSMAEQQEQQGPMDVQQPEQDAGAPPPPALIATPDAVKAAEKAALNVHKKLNVQSAPIRQYLEGTVVPVLMQGLQAVCKERPENPVEYLAYYLLSHNPQKSAAGTTQQPNAQ